MRKRLWVTLIICALLAGSIFFIVSNKKTETVTNEISLALIGEEPEALIFSFAEKTGLFQQYPLDLKWERVSNTEAGVTALNDKVLDLLITTPESLLTLTELPEDLVLIGQLGGFRSFHIMGTEKDASFGLKDLKGKNILTMPENSVETALLKETLVNVDLTPYRDINFTTNLPPKAALELFKVSKTYYLQASEPLSLKLEKEKEGYSLQRISYPYPSLVFVTNQSTLLSKKKELSLLFEGLALVKLMVSHHEDESLVDTLNSSTVSLSQIKTFKNIISESSFHLSEKELENMMETLKEVHFINRDKDLPRVDSSLVREIKSNDR